MKKNITHQNLWDAAKAIVRGQFRAILAYVKNKRTISNKQRMLIPQDMRKRTKIKIIRNKQITKIRDEINKLEILKFRGKKQQEGLLL